MDLNFKIQYKKGLSNATYDALSRCPEHSSLHAVYISTSSCMGNLQDSYSDDLEDKSLLTELSVCSPNDKGFSLHNGLIRYKGSVWVGNNQLAQQHILQSLHSSGVGGQSSFCATYHGIKSLFAWPKLKAFVTAYVQACQIFNKQNVNMSNYLACFNHCMYLNKHGPLSA